jgi:predicted glycoside hydrolase/deacetylase ChbG (UPF0249 family)
LAAEYGCGTRSPFPTDVSPDILLQTYPEAAIRFASVGAVEQMRSMSIHSPDHFLVSFFGPSATLTHMLTLLQSIAPGVTELMCHPGYQDSDLQALSNYVYEREEELRILTHPAAREAIDLGQIHLTTYRDAWGNSQTP